MSDEVLLMGNNKTPIFLAVLFVLCIMGGLPPTSISADEAVGRKEIKKEIQQQNNPYTNAKISIKIIPSVRKTFGYDILLYDRPLVHQPNIPGLPGNDGFKTREQAKKVAVFVIRKIRKNEMPPTVSIDDLKNMGILK
jgi:hypothetical protein